MELSENLFIHSLEKLEKLLAEDFLLLSSEIKKISDDARKENKSNYSNLIQVLQYHDLIRQKIQHVQQLNLLLNEEMKEAGVEMNCRSITPELFVLMIELLRFSQQEYTKVVARVEFHLSKLTPPNSWNEHNIKMFYEEILALIYKMEMLYIKIGEKEKRNHLELINAQEKMRKVYQSFSMESERQIYKSIMGDNPHFKDFQKMQEGEDSIGHIDLF